VEVFKTDGNRICEIVVFFGRGEGTVGEETEASKGPADVARASYLAYVNKDRDAIEALIADDFHFTSPLDNYLNRTAYFERCWPNSATISDFKFVDVVAHGEQVFVVYEGSAAGRRCFRNSERLTIRGGKIVEAEVYFGWTIPHPAPEGG
jgi:ketosteroid isomerase-like protein